MIFLTNTNSQKRKWETEMIAMTTVNLYKA